MQAFTHLKPSYQRLCVSSCPFPLGSCQVEETDEFGHGIVRKKRIQKLLEDNSWTWCGGATRFAVIAALTLGLWFVLAAFDVISDVADTWESATTVVLGVPGVLVVLQYIIQVYI